LKNVHLYALSGGSVCTMDLEGEIAAKGSGGLFIYQIIGLRTLAIVVLLVGGV
jgi:hypothetical protein